MNIIALAQINPIPACIEENKNKILKYIEKAQENKANLIIFPKDFLYGYHNFDMYKKFAIIEKQIENAINEIKEKSNDIATLINFPSKDGYLLIKNNEINNIDNGFMLNNEKFAIYCDDLMNDDFDNVLFIENQISRTNSQYFKNKKLTKIAKKYQKKVIQINQVGANDELVYDGLSSVYDEKGEIIALAKAFKEDLLILDKNKRGEINNFPKGTFIPTNLEDFSLDYENDLERTYEALILSIQDYFSKNGFKKAVLGLSGGLDSTICAVLLTDALGKENVLGVSMPSKLTSMDSKNDAMELAKNLGINFIETPIKEYHKTFSDGFAFVFNEISKNWSNRYINSFTQDNIQARSRAMILWGIANEFGETLSIATSDKSETYMGYATINGDMSGGFAPILDVCKTKLFALARWMNENREFKNAIPESIILKPPGAELALDPKTGKTLKAEDALMPYEFLDEVIWRIENLHESIENMMQDKFLYEKKYILDDKTKKMWLEKFFRRLNSALYKGYISAPSPIIDTHSINKIEYKQPITSKIKY